MSPADKNGWSDGDKYIIERLDDMTTEIKDIAVDVGTMKAEVNALHEQMNEAITSRISKKVFYFVVGVLMLLLGADVTGILPFTN